MLDRAPPNARRQHQLPWSACKTGTSAVFRSTMAHDLGIHIDTNLSMLSHVQPTVARCFSVLRQLRSIRQSAPTSVFRTLVVGLVLSKFDYGNATLVGPPTNSLNRLQSVAQCCDSINRWSSLLSSHHRHSCQFGLASSS